MTAMPEAYLKGTQSLDPTPNVWATSSRAYGSGAADPDVARSRPGFSLGESHARVREAPPPSLPVGSLGAAVPEPYHRSRGPGQHRRGSTYVSEPHIHVGAQSECQFNRYLSRRGQAADALTAGFTADLAPGVVAEVASAVDAARSGSASEGSRTMQRTFNITAPQGQVTEHYRRHQRLLDHPLPPPRGEGRRHVREPVRQEARVEGVRMVPQKERPADQDAYGLIAGVPRYKPVPGRDDTTESTQETTLERSLQSKRKVDLDTYVGKGYAGDVKTGITGAPPRVEMTTGMFTRPVDAPTYRVFERNLLPKPMTSSHERRLVGEKRNEFKTLRNMNREVKALSDWENNIPRGRTPAEGE